MLNADTLFEVDEIYMCYCIIFTSSIVTEKVKESFEKFKKFLKNIYCERSQNTAAEEESTKNNKFISNDSLDTEETNYKKSPFYKHYITLYNSCIQQNSDEMHSSNTLNEFYYPQFVLFTTKKYFSYLPLWATCYSNAMGLDGRISNSNAENWFNIVKHQYLDQQHLRIGRFIDIMDSKTSSLYKLIEVSLSRPKRINKRKLSLRYKNKIITNQTSPKTQCTVTPRNAAHEESDPENIQNEEMWSKKVKLTGTPKHIGRRVIDRYERKKLFKTSKKNHNLPTTNILQNESLCILQNGYSHMSENGISMRVINTCSFDSLAQIYYSLGVDAVFYKKLFQNSSNEFYKYISSLVESGATRNNYIMRTNLFLNFSSREAERSSLTTTVDVNCNIVNIIQDFVPRSIELEFTCPKDEEKRRRSYFFIPIDIVKIKQIDLQCIDDIISLPSARCSKCQGHAIATSVHSINGLALIDVQAADMTNYCIKIKNIQQIISISEETLFLKGIIHFDSGSNPKSMGHYRSFIVRPNGEWELYDDLLRRHKVVDDNHLVNPTVLIYWKN